MARYGYARVSTRSQTNDSQLDALHGAGCELIWTDTASGRLARRPEWDKCLDYLRAGDELVITRLSRMARSVRHLTEVAALLSERGVDLVVLKQGIDTTTPVGRFLFHVIGAMDEMLADLISEGTREGLEAARARGRTGGRKPKLTADNADLVLDGGRPVLKRRTGKDRLASALALENAIHQRLSERGLLDILTRTAYQIGWTRHFGPPSGSDPKLADALGRYVLTAFCYGTGLGPAQVARHMRGQVSAHELARAFHQHCGPDRLQAANTDVINSFARLDVAKLWGDGHVVAADGSQVNTWENNLLAETSIRCGGFGQLAYRHVSDTYIALFSRFMPCGVWEAVYILDGLLQNTSDIQPDTIHADTQGQSLPVYGLAALLGFELLPRIRNWHDLIFYQPDATTRYQHIESLFGSHAIDWRLLEQHWPDLLRTAMSIREGRVSSVTLLRRLGNHSHKTACTGRFGSWAGCCAPSCYCGICPTRHCGRPSPRSPTGSRHSTASPTGSHSESRTVSSPTTIPFTRTNSSNSTS